jgi:hypothetical protein
VVIGIEIGDQDVDPAERDTAGRPASSELREIDRHDLRDKFPEAFAGDLPREDAEFLADSRSPGVSRHLAA